MCFKSCRYSHLHECAVNWFVAFALKGITQVRQLELLLDDGPVVWRRLATLLAHLPPVSQEPLPQSLALIDMAVKSCAIDIRCMNFERSLHLPLVQRGGLKPTESQSL